MDSNKLDFTLRKAFADDAEDIFEWRNNELTRAMSLNSVEIIWEDHKFWYENAINSPNEIILIGDSNKQSIGVVRFTRSQPERVLVSINLNPNFRGMGLGKLLLGESVKWLEREHGEIKKIFAEIKTENLVSIAMFKSCGFKFAEEQPSSFVDTYVRDIKP